MPKAEEPLPFGALLRQYRIAAGLTQEALADRTGMGVSSIQHLEGGAHLPQRETVGRLLGAMRLSGPERRRFEQAAQPTPRQRKAMSVPLNRMADDNARHNLPAPLTSFVGREAEVAAVADLLRTRRLVTLVGVGGCGKTRLALAVAERIREIYPDGVWLVELAPLTDPAHLPRAIGAALGVREQPRQLLRDTLAAFLRPRSLLLVLDNCEHLVADCARLAADLLQSCPTLTLMATSREAMGIPGEVAWRVPSLTLPDRGRLTEEWQDPVASLLAAEAAQLFGQRAGTVDPSFAVTAKNAGAIAEICWRLDGIPLALELAAARIKVLNAEQILARLDDRFQLLTGGSRTALPRQQTLRATLDWSYNLLSDPEQATFRHLSVFAGGFSLDAAEAVCGGSGVPTDAVLDLVSQLVDKSLVLVEKRGGDTRYWLLETVRQYARERLATSGEADEVQDAHAVFFLTLVEEMRAGRWELYEWAHLDRLVEEHDNLRAALQGFADRGDAERSVRFVRALGTFWYVRGYLTEGQSWLDASLRRSTGISAELRAELLGSAGQLAMARGDLEVAATFARASVAIWRQLGDRRRLAEALNRLGSIARDQYAYPEALAALEESLKISQESDERLDIARNLFQLGLLARQQSQLPRARTLLENTLAIARAFDQPRFLGQTLLNLGLVAADQGDYPRAQSLYQESIAIFRQMNSRLGVAFLLEAFASLAAARGDIGRAAVLSGAAAALRQETGSSVPPAIQPRVDRAVRLAREGLGDPAFAAAWAEGQAMTLDQAIALSLEEDGT